MPLDAKGQTLRVEDVVTRVEYHGTAAAPLRYIVEEVGRTEHSLGYVRVKGCVAFERGNRFEKVHP